MRYSYNCNKNNHNNIAVARKIGTHLLNCLSRSANDPLLLDILFKSNVSYLLLQCTPSCYIFMHRKEDFHASYGK